MILLLASLVHENLYKETAANDLAGLASNISDDLLPSVASKDVNYFGITTILLRLDRYENVKYAYVLKPDNSLLHSYRGSAVKVNFESSPNKIDNTITNGEIQERLNDFKDMSDGYGTNIIQDELVALYPIGNPAIPLGKLLIVNDIQTPLVKTRKELIATAAPVTIFILVSVILTSLWITSRLLLPFSKLAELAQKTTTTKNYSIELETSGKKEFRTLALAFSDMMKTIFAEEQKSKRYIDALKEQQLKMEKVANYDELTGLANRHHFTNKLQQYLSEFKSTNGSCALFYIDLDGFKGVNDSYGHHVGDSLLKQATHRMKGVVGDSGVLCRFGGDEFLFLTTEEITCDSIGRLSQSLLFVLNQPYTIEQWEIESGASIGITYAEDANYDIDLLISNADTAMYEAKEHGKNNVVIFNEAMVEKTNRRILIANSLLNAIRGSEFSLYYQGKVNDKGETVGFEGLVRWIHPTLGFISPDEFIKIAENSGRINSITYFVIEQACKDIHKLIKVFGRHIVVSLNLSSNDLNQPELLFKIKAFFKQYDISPTNIQFEVTESAYLENFNIAQEFFEEISSIGCSIALDDFGTGYSSLSYLTKINIDTLKIDREFVQEYGDSDKGTLVTNSIIHLAKKLDLKVCAEGVETIEQVEALFAQGCDELQGYYFFKPMPLEKLLVQPTDFSSLVG